MQARQPCRVPPTGKLMRQESELVLSLRRSKSRAGRRCPALALALVLVLVLPFSGAALARPAIVELYTSEGCSSCPPAEQLIEKLSTRADVLPLAFHVDYWDGLGWRDRFSMQEATQRQQQFAHHLQLSTVGTPQFIVEGRAAVWGANPRELAKALEKPRSDVPVLVERQRSFIVVHSPAQAITAPYEVYVIGYLPKAVTAIGRGENAGHTLTEVNVVRYAHRIGLSGGSSQSWSVPLNALPRDATRLIVLLQAQSDGAILGASEIEELDRS